MSRFVRLALAALIAAVSAVPASAQDGRSQILASVSRELPFYVAGVDAQTLTTHQLAAIRGIIHGSRSHSDKRLQIKSVLGGPYSLRSLFFN